MKFSAIEFAARAARAGLGAENWISMMLEPRTGVTTVFLFTIVVASSIRWLTGNAAMSSVFDF